VPGDAEEGAAFAGSCCRRCWSSCCWGDRTPLPSWLSCWALTCAAVLLEPLPSLLLLFPLFPFPLSAPSLDRLVAFLVGGSDDGCAASAGISSTTGDSPLDGAGGDAAGRSSVLSW